MRKPRFSHISKNQKILFTTIFSSLTLLIYILLTTTPSTHPISLTKISYSNPTPTSIQTIWKFPEDTNNNSSATIYLKPHYSKTWQGPYITTKTNNAFLFTSPKLQESQYYNFRLIVTNPKTKTTTFHTMAKTGISTYNTTLWDESQQITLYSQTTTSTIFTFPYYGDQNNNLTTNTLWINTDNKTTPIKTTTTSLSGQKHLIINIPVNQTTIGQGTLIINNWHDPDGIKPTNTPPNKKPHLLTSKGSLIPSEPIIASTSQEIFISLPFTGDINNNSEARYRYRVKGSSFSNWDKIYSSQNIFSTFISDIIPNTEYEIEISLKDPEGTLTESFTTTVITKKGSR